MTESNISLPERLESLSYHFVVSGIGFALSGAIIHFKAPTVAYSMEATGTIFMICSVIFYRLSNHE
jgi:hypothetical protein